MFLTEETFKQQTLLYDVPQYIWSRDGDIYEDVMVYDDWNF